jgi:MFS family permease
MLTVKSPRAAIMLVYAFFGAAVGAWAGAIPLVSAASGVDSFNLGFGLAASALATAIAMTLGGTIGKYFSNRTILLLVLPLVSIVLFALLTAHSTWIFLASLVAFGALLGFTDLFMNAEASAIEHDLRRPVFTGFHGSVSLGMAIFAIISSVVSTKVGPWAMGLFVALTLVSAWVAVYSLVPPRNLATSKTGGLKSVRQYLPLLVIGLAAGLSISAETSAMFWSAKLLNDQAPALASIAGLGAAFYGICNAAVRFSGDRLRARFGDIPLMLGSLLCAVAGFAGLGFSFSFAWNVLAFALVGGGLAVVCPCLFNMAATQVPANRAAGLGFMSLVAGLPRIPAPWVFGAIAANYTTSFAFGLCAVVSLVALGLIACLRKMELLVPAHAADIS